MSQVEARVIGGRQRYLVRFRDESGKQRARTFLIRTEADEWLALMEAAGPSMALRILDEDASGSAYLGKLTVGAWVKRHIESLTGVTGGTTADYLTYLRRDIAPTLGPIPLDSLTREAVGKWVNALAAGRTVRGEDKPRPPLSGKSIRNRHSLLSAAMTSAVREGHVANNPCKGIRLPRTDHLSTEMVVLSQSDQEALLAAAPTFWRPLIFTLLRTGLRWSEATALEVGDARLDDLRKTIRVRRSWKHTDSKAMEIGPPKSRRGTRSVTITAELVDVLRHQVAGRRGDDYVFTAPRGGVVRQSTFYDSVWAPTVTRAGLSPRPRVHDLRHTNASWLLSSGVPLYNVSLHLGHESITTTADRYGHLVPDAHEAMSAAMEATFQRSGVMADVASGTVVPVLESRSDDSGLIVGEVA